MNDPTPALDALVEQGVRPRVEYLSGADRGDHRLRADGSARAALRRERAGAVARLPAEPDRRRASASRTSRRRRNLDEIADHIAEFSLAGIHAVGRAVHAR